VERLGRRAAGLERQLEARITQVSTLQDRLAEQERVADRARRDATAARREAEAARFEYDALMHTVTMRAVRVPRAWYAAARRRLLARGGPPGTTD